MRSAATALLATAAASKLVTFHIALKQNEEGLKELERRLVEEISNIDHPNYGKYMTHQEVGELVQAHPDSRKMIMDYMTNFGGVDCEDVYDVIVCRASVETVNKLLKVEMEYEEDILNSKTAYTIPDELKNDILFIDGISNKIFPKQRVLNATSNAAVDKGLVTEEVTKRLYNVNSSKVGKDVSVGAMEFQGNSGFSASDLATSQQQNGVANNPINDSHNMGQRKPADGESQLDVQVMYFGAEDATLWYDNYPGWIYAWTVDFQKQSSKPQVTSLSFGWSETDQCSITSCGSGDSETYTTRASNEFMKMGAQGTSIFISSGDAGSPGRTNEFCESKKTDFGYNNMNPVFPAGSPWVTAVGATYVVAGGQQKLGTTPVCQTYVCATGSDEQGTTQTKTGWTSGAGFTHWFKQPSYQKDAVQGYLNSGVDLPNAKFFNQNGRGYPDVSANGHMCYIQNGGKPGAEDGTSCSAPIFAGLVTNLNAHQQANGRPVLGFANPLFYKMAAEMPSTFNDVLVGESAASEYVACDDRNFGFLATKGWDPIGGLGTPNIGEMKKYLDNKAAKMGMNFTQE